MNWREDWQTRVQARIQTLSQSRVAHSAALIKALAQVQTVQKMRLTQTYADFLLDPKLSRAALFFLNELYCPAPEAIARDADVQRILPLMAKVLPKVALEAIASAVELDALSAQLDLVMAQVSLDTQNPCVDMQAYIRLFKRVGQREDRLRQVQWIEQSGNLLAQAVRLPLIVPTVKMMHLPAKKAGLLRLHQFLASGLIAFKALPSAQDFLVTILQRESAFIDQWLGEVALKNS